jgi:hypothetical protein
MANCALALQPCESPKHLTEAGSQPPASKLLVDSFPAQQKKGDLYRRTVSSSRHGQCGFCRGLRDLQ